MLALVFMAAAAWRSWRDGGLGIASRTWLLVGAIFGGIGGWLWLQ